MIEGLGLAVNRGGGCRGLGTAIMLNGAEMDMWGVGFLIKLQFAECPEDCWGSASIALQKGDCSCWLSSSYIHSALKRSEP